jgi:hypothetical protein
MGFAFVDPKIHSGRPSRVSLDGEMGSSPKRLPALMGFAAS